MTRQQLNRWGRVMGMRRWCRTDKAYRRAIERKWRCVNAKVAQENR